jgi:hypothetical protein
MRSTLERAAMRMSPSHWHDEGTAGAVLPPPAAKDNGDVEIVKEQTFEETLKIQRDGAKLAGRYIVLEDSEGGRAERIQSII